MNKSKTYTLRKHLVHTVSWEHDENKNLHVITIGNDLFTVMQTKINPELYSFEFYKGGDLKRTPLEYGARLEFDENDKDYWRCYTQIPAFMPDQINSGGSYDPFEAVLLAFEQDMYL